MDIISYDIDGVIYFGAGQPPGLTPPKNAVIITGRSIDEQQETINMLHSRQIYNTLYMNPIKWENKTRESSGLFKSKILNNLKSTGNNILYHIDDDLIQIEIIKRECPWLLVIQLDTPFVEKENVKHKDII